jgi:hypothetical protein
MRPDLTWDNRNGNLAFAMHPLAIALLVQVATPAQERLPALEFPDAGLDDTAAYRGYRTRLFRDAAGNTVQIYIDGREGRVVHLWANADNESLGFTVRDARGRPVAITWGGAGAEVGISRNARWLEYELAADAPVVHLGAFLLGSMRVERDFQYQGRHREPFGGPRFLLPELDRMLLAIERLEATERRRHLALLGASDPTALRARLHPTITTIRTESRWTARAMQPSLDGRDTLVLQVQADPRVVSATLAGDSVTLRARSGDRVAFTVRIATTAEPLTPLTRDEIFSPDFLTFLEAASATGEASGTGSDSAVIRARWLERQVRGVELLSSREKLMAGLPNYGTYFGRDMLLSALMMRSIWRGEMSEFVVASVLRKLSPSGQVSHEEALGGQAVREAAAEYATLLDQHRRAEDSSDGRAADSLLARARAVLAGHRQVRENYHMIDDEFQLPVLAARWIADPTITDAHKRAFLLDASDGGEPRLTRLLRELALVTRLTAAYVRDPIASNLVAFAARDSAWAATSWRDSNAGYAGGRFAMDVNAIWVPHALESIARILEQLRALGFSTDSLAGAETGMTDSPLASYARDSLAMRRAIEAWRGAERHFVVRLGPAEVRTQVAARLAAMPEAERAYWTRLLERSPADEDALEFLALALDAGGRAIGVANTDPATRLFLGELRGHDPGAAAERLLRDVRLFVRDYPVGLFIDRVGPVVANDAYAPPAVWAAFERDHYHGPKVVWGREVNLFLLGVTQALAEPPAATARHAEVLRAALQQVMAAVEASGFQSELWSYDIRDGRLVPVRYGTGSDVQLWSTTDLAVQFALSRVRR